MSGGMWSWNYEEMVDLKPDLVIEWSYGVQTVRSKLAPLGIPVIGYGPQDNLTSLIYFLGLITNHTNGALRLINFINDVHQVLIGGLSHVSSRYRAYVIFDYEYSLWFTSGPSGDPYWAVVNAGLQPCFNKSMQVEPGAVLQCDPDVIVAVTWNLNPRSPNATAYCEAIINSIRSNPVLNATNAVRYGRIIVIPGYLTEGPPQVVVSLYIASQVYPSAFRGVNATQYLDQYFEDFLRTAEPGGVWWCSG
ncbi:ABC transporter substrate-binding protein [Vulcanisaeta sp. JCM 14467]|uniref:ABC transporter substrate-binding protein n=1 Tax=Vulcanisaeta sp. JCM 14467 TaxID=1295370 RepID=UPI002092D6E3|nr:ABC transporter substrate-binding protein [Vulcanisaeta sp. JCM 14467]